MLNGIHLRVNPKYVVRLNFRINTLDEALFDLLSIDVFLSKHKSCFMFSTDLWIAVTFYFVLGA